MIISHKYSKFIYNFTFFTNLFTSSLAFPVLYLNIKHSLFKWLITMYIYYSQSRHTMLVDCNHSIYKTRDYLQVGCTLAA